MSIKSKLSSWGAKAYFYQTSIKENINWPAFKANLDNLENKDNLYLKSLAGATFALESFQK